MSLLDVKRMAGRRRQNANRNRTQNKAKSGRRDAGGGQARRRRGGRGGAKRGIPFKGGGSYLATGMAAARTIGQAIPKGTFEDVGGLLGAAAGRGLANFTGVGDYVFNDIVHTASMPTRNAALKQRISNCEYITDLNASGAAFKINVLPLNPADPATFPWLSKVASLYQKYKFEQLIFEFRSNTSDYSAAGPLGTVILSPVYNVLADVPQSKQQLEAYAHAVSSKPSNSMMCGVECASSEDNIKWYYVRNASDAPTQFTDPGTFFTATNGLPGAVGSLGELWVHYTIKFDEPILTTRQAQQAYAQVKVTNNAAGLGDTFMAGLRAFTSGGGTGIDTEDPAISGVVSSYRTFDVASGRPTAPYFVSVDASVTTGTRLWFAAAGTYLVEYKVNFSTAYATGTAATPLYTASVATPGGGTVTAGGQCAPVLAVGIGTMFNWAGCFTVVTGVNNAAVDFVKNSAQVTTAGNGTVLSSAVPSTVRITRL